MIILDEVAVKLQNILNGTDSETQEFQNPTSFDYVVYTHGFHLDSVSKDAKGSNFIPVFIDSMGGAFNPVPKLKQGNYTIPIVFYFPVRFKNQFFALNEFLGDVFIGQYLNYGTNSGKAISNISVSRYGEIQDLDSKQFKTWIEEKYRRSIEIMEPWMSMELTLYLTSADPKFVFGNGVKTSLTYVHPLNDLTYTDDDVTLDENSIQSQVNKNSEQIEGTGESASLPFGTAYGAGFSCYYKDEWFYALLLNLWFNGHTQSMSFNLKIEVPTNLANTTIVYERTVFLESVVFSAKKGQLITLNFSFSKRIAD